MSPAREDFASSRDQIAQHGIAGQMADAVVDRLEVVDVDGEQRDIAAAAAGVEHDFAKHLLEAAAVEAAR